MTGLPSLMVAPNGARRSKSDHPALPVTLPEIVATARACAYVAHVASCARPTSAPIGGAASPRLSRSAL